MKKHLLTDCVVNVKKFLDRRSDVPTGVRSVGRAKVRIFFSIGQAIG